MAKSPTWKEIFSDKKLADTTEITIGDSRVTLGELRAFDAEQQGNVSRELQKATEMQQSLEQDQMRAANLLAELANQPRPVAQPNVQPNVQEIDYNSDPILRPLAQRLDAAVKEVQGLKESLTNELNTLKGSVQTATASYINDSWESGFRGFVDKADAVEKPILSKVQLRDALKYAADHNIVDHRKVPDPVRAALQMTETERLAAIRSAEREAGKTEGISLGRQQLAAEMPKPGVTGRRAVQPPSKNMDEAIANLANDPEMQTQLAGISRTQ
jgi:DNA repair exonuclease SbcCD ATPase subunit